MKSTQQKPLICIHRGQTRYPLRIVDKEHYLIGSGTNCQLQLSAGEIPMNFALIKSLPDRCEIVALHAEPGMFINGLKVRQAKLHAGDLVRFGEYEFEYLLTEVEQEMPVVDDSLETEPDSDSPFPAVIPLIPEKPEELSAAELVSRIELELELLDELGHYDDVDAADIGDPPEFRLRKSA